MLHVHAHVCVHEQSFTLRLISPIPLTLFCYVACGAGFTLSNHLVAQRVAGMLKRNLEYIVARFEQSDLTSVYEIAMLLNCTKKVCWCLFVR